jgi:hypothetical protein
VGPPCPAKIRAVPANYLKLPCPLFDGGCGRQFNLTQRRKVGSDVRHNPANQAVENCTDLPSTTPDWAVDNLWISPHYVVGTGLTETAERIPPE